MNRKEQRGSMYLITGVILGLLVGLVFSLWIIPVRYINTAPGSLRESERVAYRIAVAQAYLAEGDVGRALSRIGLLNDANPSEALIAQAQQMLAGGGSESQARALALLAAVVNEPSIAITALPPKTPAAGQVAMVTPTSTAPSASTQTVEITPGPSATPRPTFASLPTSGSPFAQVGEPVPVCDPLPAVPLLQVTVLDGANRPVAGVRIEISQSGGGAESFYTGLYPENGDGYADYEMTPNTVYALRVGDSGQPISGISAPICDGGSYGSLKLVFRQP